MLITVTMVTISLAKVTVKLFYWDDDHSILKKSLNFANNKLFYCYCHNSKFVINNNTYY